MSNLHVARLRRAVIVAAGCMIVATAILGLAIDWLIDGVEDGVAGAALASGAYVPAEGERVCVLVCGGNTTAVQFGRE